jgi:hypothetical protein
MINEKIRNVQTDIARDKLGFAVTYEERTIDITKIEVDYSYQRKLNVMRAKRISEDFIGIIQNNPIVNQRADGKYYVINGQHTVESLKQLGYNTVKCRICVPRLTVEQESKLFLFANKDIKATTTAEKLKSRYFHSDPDLIKIDEIVNRNGFTVDWENKNKKCDNVIHAVTKIVEIHEKGNCILERTLRIIGKCFKGENYKVDIDALNNRFIDGMAMFIERYYDIIDRESFLERLTKISPASIFQRADKLRVNNITRTTGGSVCRALIDIYNQGRRKNRIEISTNND